jgi:small subunit ribosomal protein S1
VVTGRILEVSQGLARVELGEGIEGACRTSKESPTVEASSGEAKVDLSSLSSMLQARWKGGPGSGAAKPETIQGGQIRSFRITRLEPVAKKIELELV